jgi:hypothetical protein
MQKTAQEIKNLISDHRSYICSDFCNNPSDIYQEIARLQKLLEEKIKLEDGVQE